MPYTVKGASKSNCLDGSSGPGGSGEVNRLGLPDPIRPPQSEEQTLKTQNIQAQKKIKAILSRLYLTTAIVNCVLKQTVTLFPFVVVVCQLYFRLHHFVSFT